MEVIYDPLKKLVIHEMAKRTLDEFTSLYSKDGDFPIWCNGMLLQLYTYPDTDEVVAEKLKGIVHYYEISYCECPKYPPKLHRTDMKFEQSVINMNNDKFFQTITKRIREIENEQNGKYRMDCTP